MQASYGRSRQCRQLHDAKYCFCKILAGGETMNALLGYPARVCCSHKKLCIRCMSKQCSGLMRAEGCSVRCTAGNVYSHACKCMQSEHLLRNDTSNTKTATCAYSRGTTRARFSGSKIPPVADHKVCELMISKFRNPVHMYLSSPLRPASLPDMPKERSR